MILAAFPPLTYVAAGLALVYFFGYCYRAVSWPKTIIKTLSVALLAVVALQVSASLLLVTALVLCAIGDWLLSREDPRSFLAGIGAFALGHVAYITLFLGHNNADIGLIIATPQVFLVFAMIGLAIVMALVLLPRAGDLRSAVLAYIPIIVGMGIAALGLPVQGVLIGAMLFVLSDTVLAFEMFILAENAPTRRFTPFVVWLTYWGAQAFLFLSLI